MKTNTELRALTGLRGIAAMYVAMFHYLGPLPFTNPLATFFAHGYLAVDLFFILSGFVMAMNYGHMFRTKWSFSSYTKFLGRRIARIYPLYLVATLVGFFETSRHHAMSAHLGADLALNVIMVQVWGLAQSFDGACWSLSAEWAAYLLFPLLLIPTLYAGATVRWISGVVCVAILAALCFLPNSFHSLGRPEALFDLAGPAWAIPVARCLPEFALGLLVYRFWTSAAGARIGTSRWVAPAAFAVALVLMAIPRSDVALILLFPLLILSLTTEVSLPGRILASPPFEFIGLISYSIYLDHFLLRGGVRFYLSAFMVRTHVPHPDWFTVAALFVITFPISYLAYKFIEEPGRRWLRNVFEPAKSTIAPRIASASVET